MRLSHSSSLHARPDKCGNPWSWTGLVQELLPESGREKMVHHYLNKAIMLGTALLSKSSFLDSSGLRCD